MHGSKALAGIAHPNYINGDRSIYLQHLPKELRGNFEAVRRNGESTRLSEDANLLSSMIIAAARKMDETAAPPWGKAVEALNDCKIAKRKKDQDKFEEHFAELERTIRTGADAARNYERLELKIRGLIQEKTKTASAEWKRLADMQGLVKLEQVMGYNRAVLEAIRANVSDPVQLRAITADVLRFMPPSSAIMDGRAVEESDADQGQLEADA